METYKVRIYPTAKQDMREIVQYLNTLSQESALANYDLLVEKIAGLAQMPERFPQLNDLALRAKGYRYLLVKNYLVFFVVAGDTVQIRRVLYARRDYRALL